MQNLENNPNTNTSPLDILNHFVFNNTEYTVTVLWENEEPLFKLSDIANVLGIKCIRTSILDFDNDEKVVRSMNSLGGMQDTTLLTEIGVYRLLFNSRKPIAKPFQKWVAKVIRDIQKNGKYEIENLKEELKLVKEKDIASIRASTHNSLLKYYNNKHVVYFARFGELDGKILIKVGATKDIWTTFTERHPKDYGVIELVHVIECQTNKDFEHFLLHHKNIKKYLYKKPVKLDGGISIEVILVSKDELEGIIRIANANIHKYPNAVPDIDTKMTQIMTLIETKLGNQPQSQDKKEDIEVTESQLLAIPSPEKRKIPRKKSPLGPGYCVDCDIEISNRAQRCFPCRKQELKFEITKETLEDLVHVKKVPFTTIGKLYNVSDNAIRKRCQKFGIKPRIRKKTAFMSSIE